MKLIYSLLLLAVLSCNQDKRKHVDLAIYNYGRTYGKPDSKYVDCIMIKDGKIIAAGDAEMVSKEYIPDTFISTNGFVYPGFIDAHCHFSAYGLSLYQCNLVGTTSFEDVLKKLVEYEKNNSLNWIYGRGWDQNDWSIKSYPDNTELNRLFSDKPVMLKRIDGHAALCNKKALEMAGITVNTAISGGIVEKKDGKLTGILIDNAVDPIEKIIGNLPEEKAENYLKKLEEKCYSLGLTGVVECGVKYNDIELLKKLYKNGSMTISNILQLANDSLTISKYLDKGPFKENNLVVNGIKIYADGALGSRGACLLEPYSDIPNHYGLMLTSQKDINAVVEKANQYGWQVCTHAIGDSANRTVLKIYASILKSKNDKRWRIEHAQVVNYNDYMYFSDYSIVPSVQPTHAISDMPWAVTRIGENRLPEAYAYKNLLKLNGWIALGTDFPVEEINPLATFYTAVARKDKNGYPENGYMKNNALTREEALKGMTLWAAKSVFMEKQKGSIEIGKDADIVILDKDIMTIPENEILNTKVLYTISAGKIKYKAK